MTYLVKRKLFVQIFVHISPISKCIHRGSFVPNRNLFDGLNKSVNCLYHGSEKQH